MKADVIQHFHLKRQNTRHGREGKPTSQVTLHPRGPGIKVPLPALPQLQPLKRNKKLLKMSLFHNVGKVVGVKMLYVRQVILYNDQHRSIIQMDYIKFRYVTSVRIEAFIVDLKCNTLSSILFS